MKCYIGIGILAVPEAFKEVGILGGVVGMALIATLNGYTILLNCKTKEKLEFDANENPASNESDALDKPKKLVVKSYSHLSLLSTGQNG